MSTDTAEVVHHPDDRFYELLVNAQFAGLLVYEPYEENKEPRYVLTHTFIADGHRGQGMSWVLLKGALDDLKSRHVTITNFCPVVHRFLQKNPEYLELVDPAHPGQWPEDHPAGPEQ
jgi:predicted GNAT family acetyltransferase